MNLDLAKYVFVCDQKLFKTKYCDKWIYGRTHVGFIKNPTIKQIRALEVLDKWKFENFTRAQKVEFFRNKLKESGYHLDHEAMAAYQGHQAGEITSTAKSGLRLWTEKNRAKYVVTELWVK